MILNFIIQKKSWPYLMLTCLFLAVSWTTAPLSAQSYEEAAAAYDAGTYREAVRQFEALIKSGEPEAAMYYNLGNAYFKQGSIPQAILNYEKALQLQPSLKDAKYNLKLANQQIVDPIEAVPPFFLTQWCNDSVLAFSANQWTTIALIVFWLTIALVILRWLMPENAKLKPGIGTLSIALLLSLLSFTMAYSRNHWTPDDEYAIILTDTDIKPGPDANASLGDVPKGTKILLKDIIDEWYLVQLPDKQEGWVDSSYFEKI